MAQIASQFAGQLKVAALNVDDAPRIARRFNVRSIPAFVIVKNGQVHSQFAGFSRGALLAKLADAGVE